MYKVTLVNLVIVSTVDENIIGAPKMRNIFWYQNAQFSNIAIAILNSNTPCKVVAHNLLSFIFHY